MSENLRDLEADRSLLAMPRPWLESEEDEVAAALEAALDEIERLKRLTVRKVPLDPLGSPYSKPWLIKLAKSIDGERFESKADAWAAVRKAAT